MSIPSNFNVLEQQVLSVTSTSANVQFTKAATASNAGDQCFIFNNGTKACQVAIGYGSNTAVQDGAADGTSQIKVGAGIGVLVRLNGARWIAAITEGSDTTTLYCHRGDGQ
jgi:hypothetical protein